MPASKAHDDLGRWSQTFDFSGISPSDETQDTHSRVMTDGKGCEAEFSYLLSVAVE